MGLGVGQGEGRAPGAAEDEPGPHAQVLAQALHVGHERPRRIGRQVRLGLPGAGQGAAAAALVEQDDAVALGVEEPPVVGGAAAAGAAVEE